MIPRQQVIPFTVQPNSVVDLTFNTKYDHDKVMGVVLLPDRNIHGDTIYLEINRETILPHGFNAGLIAFQQFLNREIDKSTYAFEEWARGSKIRIIYKNNDLTRSVKIDLLLFTVVGDTKPIEKRKKLQIVPVQYIDWTKHRKIDDIEIGFEPFEIREKTNYYYQEFIGVFVDYFKCRLLEADSNLTNRNSGFGELIQDFIYFCNLVEDAETQEAAKKSAEALQVQMTMPGSFSVVIDMSVVNIYDLPEKSELRKRYVEYVHIMKDALFAFSKNEPVISQKNLQTLQDSIESRYLYHDSFQSFSTFELTVGGVPIFPEDFLIANITPRYRKSFNETMYRKSMQVQEADIYIRFEDLNIRYKPEKSINSNNYFPDKEGEKQPFSVYFLYNQTSEVNINL